MHGKLRIDPVFTVVFAITLVAVPSNHSDGSGLSDRATRSAQLSQLAQTPNPPLAGQSRPESSTSSAPALPPAAPPSNPSPGTPAVVLDDQEVSTILGKSVRSSADEDIGRIVDIIVSRDGQIHAAIIDFGGLLGIGTRRIAIDWRVLNFAPVGKHGAIILELTRNQVRLAPEYKRGEPVVMVGPGSPERAMPSSEVAAPEK